MSEIEKMYENCGIYPDCKARECGLDYCANSSGCGYAVYPDFTAEKQLEILCFIVNNKHSVTFHDQVFRGDKLTLEKIQENLAWEINRIWQDLTSEEKQQVKGILE